MLYIGSCQIWGFLAGSDGKESTCNVGDLGLIPGLGRSAGEGNGRPLQYSDLENSMDCGAYSGVAESDTTKQLSLSLLSWMNKDNFMSSFQSVCFYFPFLPNYTNLTVQ